MIGLINVFGALLSAAWKGSPQNEKSESKLIEELSADVSPNLTRANAYLANLVKDSSNKNIGELATASSDQSFISYVSELISVTANQIFGIINLFAFWDYPPKKELINRLKADVSPNLTRANAYLANLVKDSSNKNIGELATLSNDFYKAASRTAALILVLAPVLYLAYNNMRKAQRGDDLKINETRRNNILKKFKTLSKKALIHDRFEKIQKENTQIKESKQVSEPIESQVSVSQINIQKPHSLEESKENVLKAKSSASSNQFLSAFSDLKKLFDPNNEPLSVSRIYKFIVL